MKDQYFGDGRDYFKYDVLESILEADQDLEQLTCVWMLTRPDGTRQGRVPFVPDPELPELTTFFHEHQDPVARRVAAMPAYLGRKGLKVFSYRDDRDDFSSLNRSEYFRQIPDGALSRSVVFFDPDNGLEPIRATERHLLFSELRSVLVRMDASSVAVVFQYCRRVAAFWESMGKEIVERLAVTVLWIVEPAVGFYVIPRDPAKSPLLRSTLRKVAGRHTPRGRGHRIVGESPRIWRPARHGGPSRGVV